MIADLEGVPESDHGLFADRLTKLPEDLEHKPLEFLYEQFTAYIEDRRRAPRDDIMTAMATATFPDGSTPEVERRRAARREPVRRRPGDHGPAALVRAADPRGAARHPGALRRDRDRIPNFIEETLRFESPLRAQFRMAKVTTTVAGVPIPAGSTMMLLPGAANRDPRLFENPAEFDLDRDNARYHVAFGHGIHHCAGAHLARAEGRVTINRLLDRTSNITISEDAHGPAGARRYDVPPHLLPPRARQPRPRARRRPSRRQLSAAGLRGAEHQLELGRRGAGGGAAVDRAARRR